MKVKKFLALLMCLVFAAAVLTGCGGGDEEYEAVDVSEELDMLIYTDGVLQATFLDGECYIDTAEGDPVDQGVYTWDGELGTIDGEANDLTFTMEDDTLILEDSDGGIYTLPYIGYVSLDEDDDDDVNEVDVSVLENTSWYLDELEYSFLPDGVLKAHNTYNDRYGEGTYTWDPDTMSGTVTIEGEFQDFVYRDGQVIIIDGLDHEYPLNPMDGSSMGGGLDDDGMGDPEFLDSSFYYDDVKITFGGNNLVNVMYDGSPDFMTGTFEWNPSNGFGFVEMEDGTVFRFAWDGEDMFLYDDEDTEYWMDEEPDQGYFGA